MTMALRDYLQTRRSEIEASMKALRAELAEISVAEAALSAAAAGQPAPIPESRPVSRLRAGSIKDWIMRVLREHEIGLETDEVIEAVKAAGGPPVSRNSMTPQLSRLKAAGMIYQQGRRWCVDRLFDGFDNGVDLDEPEIAEATPTAEGELRVVEINGVHYVAPRSGKMEDIL